MITIRKAVGSDLDAVASIYDELHREIGIVPTVFNGIEGVNLVLLEKWLG